MIRRSPHPRYECAQKKKGERERASKCVRDSISANICVYVWICMRDFKMNLQCEQNISDTSFRFEAWRNRPSERIFWEHFLESNLFDILCMLEMRVLTSRCDMMQSNFHSLCVCVCLCIYILKKRKSFAPTFLKLLFFHISIILYIFFIVVVIFFAFFPLSLRLISF